MDLHRADDAAEWESIPPSSWNRWQRFAASTHGVATPGNLFTALGLILVIGGLVAVVAREYWVGLVALAVGRFCDLVDGWLAARTKTKSPLGELLDAGVDKFTTAAIIVTLLLTSLTHWWLMLALTLPQLYIAWISFQATRRKSRLHPSRAGKLSMAAAWLGLLGIVVSQLLDGNSEQIVSLIANAIIVLSIVLSLSAIYGYLRQTA